MNFCETFEGEKIPWVHPPIWSIPVPPAGKHQLLDANNKINKSYHKLSWKNVKPNMAGPPENGANGKRRFRAWKLIICKGSSPLVSREFSNMQKQLYSSVLRFWAASKIMSTQFCWPRCLIFFGGENSWSLKLSWEKNTIPLAILKVPSNFSGIHTVPKSKRLFSVCFTDIF